jgi:hypothetical protein
MLSRAVATIAVLAGLASGIALGAGSATETARPLSVFVKTGFSTQYGLRAITFRADYYFGRCGPSDTGCEIRELCPKVKLHRGRSRYGAIIPIAVAPGFESRLSCFQNHAAGYAKGAVKFQTQSGRAPVRARRNGWSSGGSGSATR